jgi:tRNA (guanine37-N1)-methyltransferase
MQHSAPAPELRVVVVTLFPEMLEPLARGGVTGRALERGLIALETVNPRDFARDRHRTVDDRPYGGGPGMVMLYEPLHAALAEASRLAGGQARSIALSPQGRRLDQERVRALATEGALVLLCGRYEGIDERLVEAYVDEELSLGDYVLSGGEIAAMAVIDAVARLIPGVLGHERSALEDSHAEGLLDCPHYSRPVEVDGRRVPAVLLSGDHAAIRRWRVKQALGRTWLRRPDLLAAAPLDDEQRELLGEFMAEHG